MSKQQSKLLFKELYTLAQKRHGDKITLCKKGHLTIDGDRVLLWYNDTGRSTHIVSVQVAS